MKLRHLALTVLPLVLACGGSGKSASTKGGTGGTGAATGTGTGTGAGTATGGGVGVGGGASLADCPAYVPGDALAVCTATYLGGSGADHVAAVAVAPDGAVVVGGAISGTDLGLTPVTLLAGGDGAVVRLTATGRKAVSITRLGAGVTDLDIDPSSGAIAVSGDFGVAVLDATAGKLLWHADLGGAGAHVAAAPNVVAALAGSTVHVFDGAGKPLGMFSTTGNALNDIAVDAASQSVFVTGYKQDDGGPCSKYKSTFVRAFGFDGTKKWTSYDWTHSDVGSSGDCADSQGLALGMGRDGKLYYAGKSDGGNTVHAKDPRDLSKQVANVAFDPFNTPYGFKGANAVGYYARFEPATGLWMAGQFVLTRIAGPGQDPASAKANAAVPSAITADENGNVYVAGGSAYQILDHDKKTVGGLAVGPYAAYEAFALIASPDLSKRLTWTVFTQAGPANATAIAAGHGAVVFGAEQGDTQIAKGLLLTVDALQPKPGGGASDGYVSVWPAP